MTLQCGIVGLPNVGKSTLFNALTKAGIEAANYPFCTINPNTGIVAVPDERLVKISEIVNPQKIIHAAIEFVDIAGLVKGAASGEGLGNQFLGTIREANAIAHVVRCFKNDDIIHIAGKINPIEDIETINIELALADLATVEKNILKNQKTARSGDKNMTEFIQVLENIKAILNEGKSPRYLKFTPGQSSLLKPLNLLTLKPVLYIANVNEDGLNNNPYLDLVIDHAAQEGAKVTAICAGTESELSQLPDEEKQEFLEALGWQESGLARVIRAAYDLLGLQTYFTAGEKEVRAWTIHRGDTAPQAAAVIHTDFEKGFIRAEVTSYNDFITYKGEQGAKEAGKWRLEGKEYIVQNGDIIHFRFNV